MNKITCFSTHTFERDILSKYAKENEIEIIFTDQQLTPETYKIAEGSIGIMCWASDELSAEVLDKLHSINCKIVSLRSAGFSHIDLKKAQDLKMTVTRVPAYSPESIAEHGLALYMSLNRKLHQAYNRVRNLNFSLDGLEGRVIKGKTIGVIGAGHIGKSFIKIMSGFGVKILVYDQKVDPEVCKIKDTNYTDLETLLRESDVISLNCPLNESTHHLINEKTLELLKPTSTLINTGRGGLIDTKALIKALKNNKIAGVALDVYEYEEKIFSKDLSLTGISDDDLARLIIFPNVIITSHQAFFTNEAIQEISHISTINIRNFLNNKLTKDDDVVVNL